MYGLVKIIVYFKYTIY